MSPDIWMLLIFGACLALGMPVAFALGLGGAAGIVTGLSPDMLATLGTNTYHCLAAEMAALCWLRYWSV